MAQALQIELEDVAGGTSWWAGMLTTLASQTGNTYLLFVGRTEGKTLYKSGTFPSPRSSPSATPWEEWAPGMTSSLEQLIHVSDRTAGSGRDADPHRGPRCTGAPNTGHEIPGTSTNHM